MVSNLKSICAQEKVFYDIEPDDSELKSVLPEGSKEIAFLITIDNSYIIIHPNKGCSNAIYALMSYTKTNNFLKRVLQQVAVLQFELIQSKKISKKNVSFAVDMLLMEFIRNQNTIYHVIFGSFLEKHLKIQTKIKWLREQNCRGLSFEEDLEGDNSIEVTLQGEEIIVKDTESQHRYLKVDKCATSIQFQIKKFQQKISSLLEMQRFLNNKKDFLLEFD